VITDRCHCSSSSTYVTADGAKASKTALNALRLQRALSALRHHHRNDKRLSINNQGAFDSALLHLLIQGHRSVSASGRSQLRALRGGKSAIGALIPDGLYRKSMEGKTIQQLLAAKDPECDSLRERLSGVALPLLNELQDLHDRTGECLPSLFREMVLAGGYRIARMFGLSVRMIRLWSAYRKLAGPRVVVRVAPVALEGAGERVARYAGDVGVSAMS
jgi:hypothetical protein